MRRMALPVYDLPEGSENWTKAQVVAWMRMQRRKAKLWDSRRKSRMAPGRLVNA